MVLIYILSCSHRSNRLLGVNNSHQAKILILMTMFGKFGCYEYPVTANTFLVVRPCEFQTYVSSIGDRMRLLSPTLYIFNIRVALKFGIITCIAGLLGVGLGSESARRLRVKYRKADPLVCAFGLLSCAPFLFLAIALSKYHTVTTWVSLCEEFFCSKINKFEKKLNWILLKFADDTCTLLFLPDSNIYCWNFIMFKLGYSHWHNLGKCWPPQNVDFREECFLFLMLNYWNGLLFLYLQYIVIPTRRSTASAFQILMSHAFGDAGSPYLIGVVSDFLSRLHIL